jgi:RNA polymerase sigma-70 factor (ECF subfamily)
MSEDNRLLKRLRRGEKDALRRIYENYRDDLFTVAMSLLHNVHASEDCLQEVFLTIADARKNVNIRRNLKGYLVSCIANRSRNQLEKASIKSNSPVEDLAFSVSCNDPAQQLADREQYTKLLKALAQLPDRQREVFVLHVQGEMKFRQIAKLQDVSIKTVQSRYRYGIEKLRTLMGE